MQEEVKVCCIDAIPRIPTVDLKSSEKPSIPVLNVYLFMFDRVKEIQRDYIRQSYLDKCMSAL